jgi:hypothetical protein
MVKNRLVAVIPVYKPKMDDYELISFNRAKEIFNRGNLFVIGPEDLDYSSYEDEGVQLAKFEKHKVTGIPNHNKFLMSELFYSRFIDFEYMLYHQLDAFLFDKKIEDWCNQGYDYIGGPWLDTEHHYGNRVILNSFNNLAKVFELIAKKVFRQKQHLTGNGGLSLRKTSTFLEVLKAIPKIRDNWDYRNEDVFWSFVVPNNISTFKVAPFETAFKFAFDMNPERCYELNNHQLPSGCHAWPHPDNLDFWRPIIEKEAQISI